MSCKNEKTEESKKSEAQQAYETVKDNFESYNKAFGESASKTLSKEIEAGVKNINEVTLKIAEGKTAIEDAQYTAAATAYTQLLTKLKDSPDIQLAILNKTVALEITVPKENAAE
ncbi:UNVERIFIED_CONTAM: hypothetical protein O8I53_10365 [Campylobacter lari]